MTKYNIEYLNSLIENKVEENLHLDYKASGSIARQNNKTTEISKDVSALANSNGGILIYGIREDNINKHLPGAIDPIVRKDFSKEWLEQIIQDKISPRISKFKIHSIEINSNQVVYVVEVEKSDTAHQAYDKRYYKRFNFQSTAMYDYEIRDILNRNKNPKIELEFELMENNSVLIVYAVNVGKVIAKYVQVKFDIPKEIIKDSFNPFSIPRFKINELDNTVRDIIELESKSFMQVKPKYGPSRYEPILPKRRFQLTQIELNEKAFKSENYLKWEIYCDNTDSRIGELDINKLKRK